MPVASPPLPPRSERTQICPQLLFLRNGRTCSSFFSYVHRVAKLRKTETRRGVRWRGHREGHLFIGRSLTRQAKYLAQKTAENEENGDACSAANRDDSRVKIDRDTRERRWSRSELVRRFGDRRSFALMPPGPLKERFPPGAIVRVPVDGGIEAVLEIVERLPV